MNRHPKYLLLAVIISLFQLFSSGCSSDSNNDSPPTPAATIVTEWNVLALQVLAEGAVPNQYGSRAMAMVHTAMFDAINAVGQRYEPYHLDLGPLVTSNTSKAAAGAAAAHRILSKLYPARATDFDALLATQLTVIPEGTGKAAGLLLGRVAADEIMLLRSNDGSAEAAAVPFPDGTEPGEWRRTAVGMNPLMPGWGAVTPWAMTSGQQFRTAGPPALDSPEYAAAYQEVAEIGSLTSTTRSPEQTVIARFWMTGIPDHIFAVARQMADEKALNIDDNARFFALMSIALADASICGWDMKYHFGFWRPVTAIREGENDLNPDTVGDPAWTALLPAPPFPEYVSGHSTTTATGIGLLIRFHGSENFAFTRTSYTPNLEPRNFSNLWTMAEEVGMSRIYGGIHFSFSNQDGLTTGRQLGEYVFDNFLVAK